MKYIAYVGCYTSSHQADPFEGSLGGVPHDDTLVGKGILALAVSDQGKLSYLTENGEPVVSSTQVKNPSYLTILPASGDPNKDGFQPACLCAVSEIENDGKLFLFEIESATKLEQACEPLSTGGSFPCHVIDNVTNGAAADSIYVSNYGSDEQGGTVTKYSVGGRRDVKTIQTISHGSVGSREDLNRQVASHAHSCAIPGKDDVFTADLGLNAIIRYRQAAGGGLQEVDRLKLPSASGPRSLSFNPNVSLSHIGVVSLEMAGQIVLVKRHSTDGNLELLNEPVSILPSDWPEQGSEWTKFNNGRWASDVVWSHCGKYVFAAARLHNSISVFQLQNDETLRFLHRVPTQGKTPRCLTVSSEGDFLLVAHQHSHEVACFQIDGPKLTLADTIQAPLAACIKLISPDRLQN